MEIEFNQEELAFRDEVREFLKNDYPSHVKEKQDLGVPLSKQDMIDWHKAVSNKGWMAITGLKSMVVQVGRQLKYIYLIKNLVKPELLLF